MSGLDPATAKLAAELQLADVNEALDGMEGDDSDEHTAFKVMQSSFQGLIQVYEGQLFALNILRLEHATRVECERLVREERQARQDHDLARRLDGGDEDQFSLSPQINNASGYGEEVIENDHEKSALYFPDCSVDFEEHMLGSEIDFKLPLEGASTSTTIKTQTPVSAIAASAKGKQPVYHSPTNEPDNTHSSHGTCSACMERHPRFDLLELTCKREDEEACHAYCRQCLTDLFKSSLTDTTLFPPRCCGVRILLFAGAHFFTPELIKEYGEKEVELSTPNPIYCSNHFCAKFIKPHLVKADVATCAACNTKTCTVCKNLSHNGLCPEDPMVQKLMDVAGEKKWQRCYYCRTMVELVVGCYHMQCRCGRQFCYLCAKPWKTCSCSQWDENRLLTNGRVDEEPQHHQIAMPEEEEVAEANPAADVLNEMNLRIATVAGGYAIEGNADESDGGSTAAVIGCAHQWHRVYAKVGDLEVCGICHYHLKFLNHCERCTTRVCNRCLNNRL